ncbi:MAG: hypothetical protein JJV96_02450 [Alphaproteobacteria bacterium]|nr:hypothetical protein [Alphaproteobacteria bacterium]
MKKKYDRKITTISPISPKRILTKFTAIEYKLEFFPETITEATIISTIQNIKLNSIKISCYVGF